MLDPGAARFNLRYDRVQLVHGDLEGNSPGCDLSQYALVDDDEGVQIVYAPPAGQAR